MILPLLTSSSSGISLLFFRTVPTVVSRYGSFSSSAANGIDVNQLSVVTFLFVSVKNFCCLFVKSENSQIQHFHVLFPHEICYEACQQR